MSLFFLVLIGQPIADRRACKFCKCLAEKGLRVGCGLGLMDSSLCLELGWLHLLTFYLPTPAHRQLSFSPYKTFV